MNAPHFTPDDPKLTAYALGELGADERAEVEARLRDDPAARTVVEAIRSMGTQIEQALAGETMPEVALPARPRRRNLGRLLHFPKFYYAVGTLAAACLTMLVVLHEPKVAEQAKLRKHAEGILSEGASTDQKAMVQYPSPVAAAEPMQARDANGSVGLRRAEAPAQVAPATVSVAGQMQISAADAVAEHRVAGRMAVQQVPLGVAVPTKDSAAAAPLGGAMAEEGVVTLTPFAVREEKDFNYLKANSATATKIGMEIGQVAVLGQSSQPAEVQAGKMKMAKGIWGAARANGEAAVRQMAYVAEPEMHTEAYAYQLENGFLNATQNPLSTFSIDVDTASYANVRRFLNQGQRPPVDAVRIEELVNYFSYHYAAPTGGNRDEGVAAPFAAALEVAEAPWAPGHRLVRIGLKGREVSVAARPAANLVFLLDVSGSMNRPNKLPLVKESLRLLLGKLRADDRVAIITYAGHSGLALPSTPVRRSAEIMAVLDELRPGGSTNGAMGIQLAYDIAKANFVPGGLNRVILCTDGDFNVGTTSEGELTRLIGEKAQSGVFLTVLGFGMGNYKDATLEQLADQGNGHYGYVDSRREAEKLLVEQVNGTLVTIAKDVKIQVEFNPAEVQAYRLIGYENRMLKKEDFNNDAIDAGEIGAGHTVTALYEVVPVGGELPVTGSVDALKYQRTEQGAGSRDPGAGRGELLTVKVRYKDPADDVSQKQEFPLTDRGASFAGASADFKFAAAVAGFGLLLRDSEFKGTTTYGDVTAWVLAGVEDDAGGYRSEFLTLVDQAARLR
jgi:Ca-activated chloride channel family protein